MARPHIEFIEALDVEPELLETGSLAGATRRLLSADVTDSDFTALLTCPAGWTGDIAVAERPVELFCVSGALTLDGQRLGPGCYAYLPAGTSRGRVQAAGRTHVLLMVEQLHAPEPDEPIRVIDQADLKWVHPGLASGKESTDRAEGIVLKLFREDPETKDWTWISTCCPGWLTPKAEVHPTVEECLMLRGDILLGERGAMSAGSYFWRPGLVEHGPMFSRDGGLFFFRTKGGSLNTEWVDVPGWERLVDEYVGRRAFSDVPLD